MPAWLIIVATGLYFSVLFYIAHRSDARGSHAPANYPTIVFGLSIAVYCTSWTFYGAVGSAATSGWDYLPIYLGPALVFLFGLPILRRMIDVGQRQHVTSIADFISARYGKSQRLAALVTLIALLGTLPYIALQLKSIAMTYIFLTRGEESVALQNDVVLLVAGLLALFAIMFGTRHADVTQPNRGMVQAIAVESGVKITALIAVAVFSLSFIIDSNTAAQLARQNFTLGDLDSRFVTLTVLSIGAILCLPRQFHMTVVEAHPGARIGRARWVFIGYLCLTALLVLPITLAGLSALPTGANPDLFVLQLPAITGNYSLELLTFLGGFSAATGMVIVASVALSTMVSNDIILPLFMRQVAGRDGSIGSRQLLIRRAVIIALLVLAYGFHRIVTDADTLASLGILSFAAAIQFLPALIGGLYWPRGNKRGVIAGLSVGFALWMYTLVLPNLTGIAPAFSGVVASGLFGIDFLRPQALFGLNLADPLTHGLLWSLGLNTLLFVGISLQSKGDALDRMQAAAFLPNGTHQTASDAALVAEHGRVKDLKALVSRCLGPERAAQAFEAYALLNNKVLGDRDQLDADLIRFGETQLTRVLGASSARLLLQSILSGASLKPEEVVTLLDETSQTLEFNRELLQTTLENIGHGVCVVDKDMRIIAWNTPYTEMFEFPDGLVAVGRPIADIIRYNADQGTWPGEDTEQVIERRLAHFRAGKVHDLSRSHFDGRYFQIQGRPIPGGGYLTTYQDVTARVRAEEALKETNETLEQRVQDRTQELQDLNTALERATASKTRFLAAASHDLLQPLNAARLFTSALSEELPDTQNDSHDLLSKIDQSITSADNLLKALLNISKLDGGGIQGHKTDFAVNTLLKELTDEFSVIAAKKGLELRFVPSSAVISSDKALLRSVLQNLLTNAIRYTQRGSVLIGCRRKGDALRIQVCDTGSGIALEDRRKIFEEFEQLGRKDSAAQDGLGLGLAIVDRIINILGHELHLRSTPGRGSIFEVRVPRMAKAAPENIARLPKAKNIGGIHALCIDNDQAILGATTALLNRWGCNVSAIATPEDLETFKASAAPDIILLDYQLNDGATGFDYLEALTNIWGFTPPVILMTAADSAEVEAQANARGIPILAKPVAPAQLRALMTQMCKTSAVAE